MSPLLVVHLLWFLLGTIMVSERPPAVTCESRQVLRDTIIFQAVYDIPGNQPMVLIELRDAETDTVCRTV